MQFPISLIRRRGPALVAAALMLGTALPAVPAFAQDTAAETRLRKLEAEVRAIQRKVFNGPTFQAEIAPPAAAATGPALPATTPLTDLLARMQSLEAQMARVTAQTEQNTNRLSQVEARLTALSPPPAPEATAPAPTAPAATAPAPVVTAPPPRATTLPAPKPASATKPSASRIQAVRAIEKPQSADAADDEYSYGFRLYDAKFYPEAEQQLKLYLQKYPKHARVSFARNLVGRAYLADGDGREAAKWFLQNYQADKKGARAPDSLLYLARTMKELGDTKRACIAITEFSGSFATEAAGRLKADYDDTRKGLSCN